MAKIAAASTKTSSGAVTATQLRSLAKKLKHKEVNSLQRLYNKYINYEFLKFLICDPAALPIISVLIVVAEFVLNLLIIRRVPYTEIDWTAYMQECEGFLLNGTTNYAMLKGDTGPLVYPAAFVYIYSALYFITSHGRNVRMAQYIFAFLYLLQMYLVLRLYSKSRKVPPYVLALSAFTSYRIHSIYVLRLFNDPVAVLFLYAALNLFLDRRWTFGSCCFSLAVGVKMNILLFAPALLLFYIINLGFRRTLEQLAVCGLVQLMLGAPFLFTYPMAYLKGSFDLGRVFEHKWTVNYRFLERAVFEHRAFHLSLLVLHLLLLGVCAKPVYLFFKNYARLRELQMQLQPQIDRQNEEIQKTAPAKKGQKAMKNNCGPTKDDPTETLTAEQEAFLKSFERGLQKSTGINAPAAPIPQEDASEGRRPSEDASAVSIHFEQCTQLALLPFFLCNFIGVMCARSLHYQFYVWYFHSLPYLAWSTNYSLTMRYLILGLIELCWNTYPSTDYSSLTLHACHAVLLVGVVRSMFKAMQLSSTMRSNQRENGDSASETRRAEGSSLETGPRTEQIKLENGTSRTKLKTN